MVFRFRLQTVLDYRRRQSEEAARALATVQREIQECSRQIKVLTAALRELDEERLRSAALPGWSWHCFLRQEYLRQKIHLLQQRRVELEKEAEKCRLALMLAYRRQKILEMLKARYYQNYQQEMKNYEQKLIDEMARAVKYRLK